MQREATSKVDRLLLKQLAVESASDERSVQKRLRGEEVRGLAQSRIDRALEKHGITPGKRAA